MGEINVDDLKEGMVLTRDLVDGRGRFLLGKGSALEDKHIRVMKIWGITSVDIEGDNQERLSRETLNQIDPGILEKARSYVDTLFCNTAETHEAVEELKHLCVLRVSERLSRSMPLPELKSFDRGEAEPEEKIIPLDALVKKNVELSSFPDIYYQIMEVLNDTRSSASRVADVVSRDTSLTATIMKLVNSAFYALPGKVDSITRAIALIGGRELSTLAVGISVIRYFKDIPPRLVDMKNFWMHSIACGVLARILAHRNREVSEEQFFLGGLLHDIGYLIMFKEFPKAMSYAIGVSHQMGIPLFEMEQEVLGYDHARVGGQLLEKWNFPSSLVQMVRYHHSPTGSRNPFDPAVLLVANIMVTVLLFGDSGNRVAPPFEKKTWEITGFSPSVFVPSIKQAERQLQEILQVFCLETGS